MNGFAPLVQRIRQLPPLLVDASIAAAIVLVETVDVLGPGNTDRAPQIVLIVLGAVGVTLRRRFVWGAFWTVIAVVAIGVALGIPESHGLYLEKLIVLYTVADRRSSTASAFALLVVVVLAVLYYFSQPPPTPSEEPASSLVVMVWIFQDVVWFGFVWFAGRAQHRRRSIAAALEQNAETLRREREQLAAAAVASERARIASDLEIVVGQAIQTARRQSRLAEAEFAAGGTPSPETFVGIEAAGRGALVQMRRLLSVLRMRSEGDEDLASPMPARGSDSALTTRAMSSERLA